MYPNVKAEFARKGLTLGRAVEKLDELGFSMTITTLSLKLNGKYPITLNEAKAIKKITEADIPIEELFEEAG